MNRKKRIAFSHSTRHKLKKIKRCENCNVKGVQLFTHHIRPLSHGGTNNRNNLARVCHDCHEKLDHDALTMRLYCLHN